ncbi:MAG TPA: DUF3048 domain-containing protein [Acidimicrobiales bacterium]|nr:DUF3048 domain-containing protein [Acidimicrobiales bacterium]
MKCPHGGRRAGIVLALSALTLFSACGGGPARTAARTTTSTPAVTHEPPGPEATTTAGARPHRTKRHHAAAARHRVHQPKHRAKPRHKARLAVHHQALCPLTGTPAPGGKVPKRAALAVKVENLPEARPQYGIGQADIVFEEPVEGGITRFIAVFQCHTSARIEPVRSARLVDPQILEPMGRLLFAYSGATQYVVNEVDAPGTLLEDVGGYDAGNAYWRDPYREEPHNLETSTAVLYAAAAALHYRERLPTPIFSYGHEVRGGTAAAAVNIYFPLDVTTWTWDRKTGTYYRSYSDTGPATLGGGGQITASNVIVMLVHEYATKYTEDINGAHENELTLKGSGPAWLFRDGVQFYGKWVRPLLDHPTVFYEKNGTKIKLTPGSTWVELVPDGDRISVKP